MALADVASASEQIDFTEHCYGNSLHPVGNGVIFSSSQSGSTKTMTVPFSVKTPIQVDGGGICSVAVVN